MLMVKAGPAVDDLIEHLIPLLSPGDVIVDGGNTHYPPTLSAAPRTSNRRVCSTLAPAFRAEKKGRCAGRA